MTFYFAITLAFFRAAVCCPIWTISYGNSSEDCRCGDSLDSTVACSMTPYQVSVSYCYCMTYNKKINQVTVGECLMKCYFYYRTRIYPQKIPIHVNHSEALNSEVCGSFKREGHLCGACIEGYGPPVYSYSLECVKCNKEDFWSNLIKYIAIAYGPLTVLYGLIIIFKMSFTSARFSAYIMIWQVITSMSLSPLIVSVRNYFVLIRVLLEAFSILNLNFFRSVYTPFCLHSELNAMHVVALDYIVAVYPIFLILATYIAVALHDRYQLIVSIWRPAHRFFSVIRKKWDIRGSLVQAFITALILSYVKILNTSMELLNYVHSRNVEGHQINQRYLFNAGTIEYFGRQHLPFGILALVMMTVFNILPVVLLFFYPYNWFRRCLLCGRHSYTLHTFMDTLYGSYRRSPRCYQSFATVFFISRLIVILLFALLGVLSFLICAAVYFIALSLCITFFQPLQNKLQNKLDVALLLSTCTVILSYIFNQCIHFYESQLYYGRYYKFFHGTSNFVVIFFLTTYGILAVLSGLLLKVPFKNILQKIQKQFNKESQPLIENIAGE